MLKSALLLEKEDFEKNIAGLPKWLRVEYEYWRYKVSRRSFPVILAPLQKRKDN